MHFQKTTRQTCQVTNKWAIMYNNIYNININSTSFTLEIYFDNSVTSYYRWIDRHNCHRVLSLQCIRFIHVSEPNSENCQRLNKKRCTAKIRFI